MYMLTDDGDMQVEEKYIELVENHYRKLSDDEDFGEDVDYKKFAEKYKSLIEEYS